MLNDPFYIVLLYTPLALFSDFSLARGVWMLFSEAALVGSVLFAIRLSEWEPPRWLFIALIVFVIFGYYSLLALISASPAIFLLFLYLSALFALRTVKDELAGALLFVSAYQWEAGALFFVFILVAVFVNKRWGVLAGFGMSLFIMLSTALILWFGGQMALAGALTVGELVAFNVYLVLLAQPVQDMGFIVNSASWIGCPD